MISKLSDFWQKAHEAKPSIVSCESTDKIFGSNFTTSGSDGATDF